MLGPKRYLGQKNKNGSKINFESKKVLGQKKFRSENFLGRYLKEVKGNSREVAKEVSSFKCVSRKFQGCFKEDLRVYQWSLKWVFKGCVKRVSRVFQ